MPNLSRLPREGRSRQIFSKGTLYEVILCDFGLRHEAIKKIAGFGQRWKLRPEWFWKSLNLVSEPGVRYLQQNRKANRWPWLDPSEKGFSKLRSAVAPYGNTTPFGTDENFLFLVCSQKCVHTPEMCQVTRFASLRSFPTEPTRDSRREMRSIQQGTNNETTIDFRWPRWTILGEMEDW